MSSSNTNSPSGRGRGRGYGIDNSPLRKPDSRNSSRPGSNAHSPRGSPASTPGRQSKGPPKATQSDSSVGSSTKTSLSVSASEFVPKSVKSQPALSVSASEFQPVIAMNQLSLNTASDNLITFLEESLYELLNNPSYYELSMPRFSNHLSAYLTDKNMMEVACDVIFEWAVCERNFAYTCARVCQYVSEHVSNNHNGHFHQHMLARCRKEHQQHKELLKENPARTCLFVIFLAELYTKPLGRVKPMCNAVLELIEAMLPQLDDNLAKTVGQTMKMCGACLEDDLGADKSRMDKLVSDIAATSTSAKISRSMSGLLMSVVTLRAANWGRSVSPTLTPLPTPSPQVEFSQEPVFFNTTGQRITREQAGYAEEEPDASSFMTAADYGNDHTPMWSAGDDNTSAGAAGDFSEYDDQIDDVDIVVVDDDEEMTEDMWAEYEKFEAERYKNQ